MGKESTISMRSRPKSSPSTVPVPFPSLSTGEILDRIHPPCQGLHPIIRFVFQSEGKRLRSRLLVLAARLFHHAPAHLSEAAILVEALHNGTLLHDDVMDRARVRRSRPTVNRLWGDSVAILAGDFLLAAVMDLAVRTQHPSVLPLALETLMQLVEGQMMELQNQGNLSLSEPTSMEIARKKTASLFTMACTLGGILAEGEPYRVRALGSFGRHLGIAFQLLDDVHDYRPGRLDTGKEPGRDLAEGKVTLPVLAAFRRAGTRDKKRIRRIFSDPGREDHLGELSLLIEGLGGFAYTLSKAVDCVKKSISALEILPPSQGKAEIEQAAWGVLGEHTPWGRTETPGLMATETTGR